jgi:hypothetical protein
MKYDKQRKDLAHAKAVESATEYLLSLPIKKKVWNRAVQMVRLPIRLKELNVLPPLGVIRL